MNQTQTTPRSPVVPPARGRRLLARLVANSWLFRRGRRLFAENQKEWLLPLSKWDKLMVGGYLILSDYACGRFPPTFEDQAAAYEAEINYRHSLPGLNLDEIRQGALRKPFWGAAGFERYSGQFARLLHSFEQLSIPKDGRILELGCGTGWMSEWLALAGYDVVGTSLTPADIELGRLRIAALEPKGFSSRLQFQVAPMESVDEVVGGVGDFDAVFVFEALHHAFDWRRTLRAAYRCLKPGGWFLMANEPNRLHTFISYRVGRISNTHEIGMSKSAIRAELRATGYRATRVISPRIDNWLAALWIAGQK